MVSGAVALCVAAGGASAQWVELDGARGLGQGAIGCTAVGGAEACLALRCAEGTMTWAIELPEWPETETLGVTLSTGGTPERLSMTRVATAGFAAAPYVAEEHAAFVDALKRGSRVTVGLDAGRIAAFQVGLGGSRRALDHAEEVCASAMPAPEVPVFGEASERFVPLFGVTASDADLRIAVRLLETELSMIDEEVEIGVARYGIDEETSLLVIESGPSTMLYGVSGFGVTLAVEQGGAAWAIDKKVGTLVWADATQTVEGWPDLWMMSARGVNQPFGLWRWTGAGYEHQRNVAP
jgi:hypothetical protein